MSCKKRTVQFRIEQYRERNEQYRSHIEPYPSKKRNVQFKRRTWPCKKSEMKIHARPDLTRQKTRTCTVPSNKRATSIYCLIYYCYSMKIGLFCWQIILILCLVFDNELKYVFLNFAVFYMLNINNINQLGLILEF